MKRAAAVGHPLETA